MNIHRQILRLSLPSVLSNITVPLLSLADMAIVGHMGKEHYIGAIAIGGTIFNMIYWLFAFLRMSTTGMAAQAHGAGDWEENWCVLLRSLLLGTSIATLLCLLQNPILQLALWCMQPEENVITEASKYYRIVIWGAPAVLAQWSLTGWYIGNQDTLRPMITAIGQNIANIILSLVLAIVLGWQVRGVAMGTLIAQYIGLIIATTIWFTPHKNKNIPHISWMRCLIQFDRWLKMLRLNTDIMLRTLCIVTVTVYFTTTGAQQGATILAANALLMQFFMLYSYFMDGLANAAEALSGRYAGARDTRMLKHAVRTLFVWGTGMAIIFTLVYWAGGEFILNLLTDQQNVTLCATIYLPWIVSIPLLAMAAFVWDGVFIGMTMSRGMLLSMALAAGIFFMIWYTLNTTMGNHALWLAFVIYLTARGCIQTIIFLHKIKANIF